MTFSIRRAWSVAVGVSVALLVAGIAACDTKKTLDTLEGESIAGALQECPQSWYKFFKDREATLTQFTLPDRGTDVPEFHDCQKFLVGDGTTYGPLIAIFSAWELDRVNARLDSAAGTLSREKPPAAAEPDRRDASGATSPLQGPAPDAGASGTAAGPTLAPGGGGPFGLATALIVNLGERYRADDFVIEPGYSCLYMWRIPGGEWGAKILQVGNEKLCGVTLEAAATAGIGLSVWVDRGGGSNPNDYPPVARWDYDPISRQQYISIKCGMAWCEIGSKSFKPNDAYPNEKVARIKGWYDEQFLAVVKTAGAAAVPSTLKGTLIPHPKLDSYVKADFEKKWAVVSYVALTGNAPKSDFDHYKSKLNLDPVAVGPLAQLNKISLCNGTQTECLPSGAAPKCSGPTVDPQPDKAWWGRIEAATTKTMLYTCVFREDHSTMTPPIHIPGTARWRWLLNDETTWERCIEGCCEIDTILDAS
jgi:hypothetical protein